MEKMLQRMAEQLAAYDEASLLTLWDKYTQEVERFQPTKRWEESVIILCLLQAVRWKNQLFNYKWMEQRSTDIDSGLQEGQGGADGSGQNLSEPREEERVKTRGRVVSFPSREKG
ncbi:MAG: hypothetical protein K9K39_09970 [Desulfohalobiaceae bacterium]|nr:hypothetical protein [Desulfohalobiaceae bacterium]